MPFSSFTVYLGNKEFQFLIDGYSSIDFETGEFGGLQPQFNLFDLLKAIEEFNLNPTKYIGFDMDGDVTNPTRIKGICKCFIIKKLKLYGRYFMLDGQLEQLELTDQVKIYTMKA